MRKTKKERSRENSLKKDKKEKDELKEKGFYTFSNENYKTEKVLEDNFQSINFPLEDYGISLFKKKEKAIELFNKRKSDPNIQIEEVLSNDNTNKMIQLEYLNILVKNLLKEKDEDKISILLEKINKAGVICDEDNYNQVVSILPEKFASKVKYKNYKKNLINALDKMESFTENDYENDVWKLFEFDKKYTFNQDCEFGENNYYFYCLIYQILISDKSFILVKQKFFKPYISKLKNFLVSKNFSQLNEEQKTYFEYVFNILTAGEIVEGTLKKELDNYLESYEAYLNGEKEPILNETAIKEIEAYFNQLNESIAENYLFQIKDNKIEVALFDKFRLGRKKKHITKTYSYCIDMFNKEMNKIIKENLNYSNYYNFEAIFQKNARYGMEYKPIEKYFDKYKEIVRKILKSNAAHDYFEKFYTTNNKELKYHFGDDKVIDEIFKRIRFCSFFKKGDQGYTSPLELKIYINCIPGEYNRSTVYPFERKSMQFARLIVVTIHEIMGHFLRRYYSYLTNNLVKFGTKEDKTFKTGVEGGSFVERNLLGLETYYSLSLNQSFGFLKEDFENAPILFNNQIPKKVLEKLVNENIDFLELIPEDKKSDVITADDLYYYFLEGFAFQIRIHCGERRENAIYIDNYNTII